MYKSFKLYFPRVKEAKFLIPLKEKVLINII